MPSLSKGAVASPVIKDGLVPDLFWKDEVLLTWTSANRRSPLCRPNTQSNCFHDIPKYGSNASQRRFQSSSLRAFMYRHSRFVV